MAASKKPDGRAGRFSDGGNDSGGSDGGDGDGNGGATPPSPLGGPSEPSVSANRSPTADLAAIASADRALLHRICRGGRDANDARDALVLSCRGLIRRVAKRYVGQSIGRNDLVQEGHVGLLTAIRKYHPSRTNADVTFRRFAVQYIHRAIRAAVIRARNERAAPIRPGEVPDREPGEPPVELGEDLLLADVILDRLNAMERLVVRARATGLDGSGTPATWVAIAQRLGIEAKWVEFFHERAMGKIREMVARREREGKGKE